MTADPLSLLLVEDNPGDARLIMELLRSGGAPFAAETVDRLADALEQLAVTGFDVALLDLSLPDCSGLEGLEAIVERHPDMAVVILTGLDDEDLPLVALQKGAQDYLVKSQLDERLLIRSIRHAMERKRVEGELRRSRQRYRIIFDGSRDAILIADADARLVDVNQAAAEITGYTIHELVTLSIPDLHAPEDQTPYARYFHRIMGGEPAVVEARFLRKDGGKIDVEIVNQRCYIDGIPYLHAVARDITGRKASERRRVELESQLRQSQKMEAVGTLAGGIAHDFNNILSIIFGNAELAGEDLPEWSPANRFIREISNACLRARDMVRQLLSFSRGAEENLRPVDIIPIIKESARLLSASIPANIEFSVRLPETCHAIMADPTQIHQILINLCTNAALAMPDAGGLITVALRDMDAPPDGVTLTAPAPGDPSPPEAAPGEPTGKVVRLSVRDTGKGIDPGDLHRIFEPYFTTREVGKGSGMGLAVVHGIVKRHGGDIRVHSRIGEGAAFDLYFPAIDQREVPAPARTDAPARGRERVLYVDDEDLVANMAGHQLERLGYQAQTFTNPLSALERFRADPSGCDLVITDMAMPRMTGDRLIAELRKIRPDIPTILCTGYSERMSREAALALGADRYLMKPYDRSELAAAVRGALDGREDAERG